MYAGLTEDFDSFLVLVALRMGWSMKDMVYVKYKVVEDRPTKDRIEPEKLAVIEEAFEEELALYNYAKMKMEHLKRTTPGFDDALTYFLSVQSEFARTAQDEVLHINPASGVTSDSIDLVSKDGGKDLAFEQELQKRVKRRQSNGGR